MTFEEDYPSLKERRLAIDGKLFTVTMKDTGKKEYVFRQREISKCCTDNQRLKESIDKFQLTKGKTGNIAIQLKNMGFDNVKECSMEDMSRAIRYCLKQELGI